MPVSVLPLASTEARDEYIFPLTLMADYLKLFHARRLTPKEPHHLEYIKARLAHMKVEDPNAYKDFSEFYGVDMDVKVTKEPEIKKTEKKALKLK